MFFLCVVFYRANIAIKFEILAIVVTITLLIVNKDYLFSLFCFLRGKQKETSRGMSLFTIVVGSSLLLGMKNSKSPVARFGA